MYQIHAHEDTQAGYAPVAAVSISEEVTAQADYIILYSGKSALFVQIKLTENNFTGAYYVMLL